MIDHRVLLKKYIDMVSEAEGTSFIGGPAVISPHDPLFTQEEWDELVKCNKEVNDEWYDKQGLRKP